MKKSTTTLRKSYDETSRYSKPKPDPFSVDNIVQLRAIIKQRDECIAELQDENFNLQDELELLRSESIQSSNDKSKIQDLEHSGKLLEDRINDLMSEVQAMGELRSTLQLRREDIRVLQADKRILESDLLDARRQLSMTEEVLSRRIDVAEHNLRIKAEEAEALRKQVEELREQLSGSSSVYTMIVEQKNRTHVDEIASLQSLVKQSEGLITKLQTALAAKSNRVEQQSLSIQQYERQLNDLKNELNEKDQLLRDSERGLTDRSRLISDYDAIIGDLRRAVGESDVREKRMAIALGEKETLLERLDTELQQTKEMYSVTSQQLGIAQTIIKALEEQKTQLEGDKLQLEDLRSHVEQQRSSVEQQRTRVEQDSFALQKRIALLEKERQTLENQKFQLEQHKRQLEYQVGQLTTDNNRLALENTKLHSDRSAAQSERSQAVSEKVQLQNERNRMEAERVRWEEERSQLQQHLLDYSTALQTVTAQLQDLQRSGSEEESAHRKEVERLEAERGLVGGERARLERELLEAQEALMEWVKWEQTTRDREVANDASQMLQARLNSAEQEKSQLHQENFSLKQERAVLHQEKSSLQQEKTTWQTEKSVLEQENTGLRQERSSLQLEKTALEQEKAHLQQDRSNLQQEKASLEEKLRESAQTYHQELQALSSSLSTLQKEKFTVMEELSTAQFQINVVQRERAAVEEELRTVKAQLETVSNRCDAVQLSNSGHSAQALELDKAKENLSALHGYLGVLEGEKAFLTEQLRESQIREKEVSQRLEYLETEEADTMRILQELVNTLQNEKHDLEAQLSDVRRELESAREMQVSAEKGREEGESEVVRCLRQSLQEAEEALVAVQEERNNLQDSLVLIKGDLAEAREDIEVYKLKEAQLTVAQAEVDTLRGVLEDLQSEKNNIKQQAAQLSARLDEQMSSQSASRLSALQSKVSELEIQVSKLQGEKALAEESLRNSVSTSKNLETQLATARATRHELQGRVEQLEGLKESLEYQLTALSMSLEVAQGREREMRASQENTQKLFESKVCDLELEKDKLAKDLRDALAAFAVRESAGDTSVAASETSSSEVRPRSGGGAYQNVNKFQIIIDLRNRIDSLEGDKVDLSSALSNLTEEITLVRAECSKLKEEALLRLHAVQDVEREKVRAESEVKALKAANVSLNEELEQFQRQETGVLSELRSSLSTLQLEKSLWQEERSGLLAELEISMKQVELMKGMNAQKKDDADLMHTLLTRSENLEIEKRSLEAELKSMVARAEERSDHNSRALRSLEERVAELQVLVEELTEDKALLQRELDGARSSLKTATSRMDAMQGDLAALETLKDTISTMQHAREQTESENKTLQNELNESRANLSTITARIQSLQIQARENDQLNNDLAALRKQMYEIQNERVSLMEEVRQARIAKAEVEAQCESLQLQVKLQAEAHESLKSNLANMSRHSLEIPEHILKPIIEIEVQALQDRIEELERQASTNEKLFRDNLQQTYDRATARAKVEAGAELNELHSELAVTRERLSLVSERETTAQAEIQRLREEEDLLKKEIDGMKQQLLETQRKPGKGSGEDEDLRRIQQLQEIVESKEKEVKDLEREKTESLHRVREEYEEKLKRNDVLIAELKLQIETILSKQKTETSATDDGDSSSKALKQLDKEFREKAPVNSELNVAYLRSQEEIRRLQEDVEQLNSDLASLTTELKSRQKFLSEAEKAKQRAEERVVALELRLGEMRNGGGDGGGGGGDSESDAVKGSTTQEAEDADEGDPDRTGGGKKLMTKEQLRSALLESERALRLVREEVQVKVALQEESKAKMKQLQRIAMEEAQSEIQRLKEKLKNVGVQPEGTKPKRFESLENRSSVCNGGGTCPHEAELASLRVRIEEMQTSQEALKAELATAREETCAAVESLQKLLEEQSVNTNDNQADKLNDVGDKEGGAGVAQSKVLLQHQQRTLTQVRNDLDCLRIEYANLKKDDEYLRKTLAEREQEVKMKDDRIASLGEELASQKLSSEKATEALLSRLRRQEEMPHQDKIELKQSHDDLMQAYMGAEEDIRRLQLEVERFSSILKEKERTLLLEKQSRDVAEAKVSDLEWKLGVLTKKLQGEVGEADVIAASDESIEDDRSVTSLSASHGKVVKQTIFRVLNKTTVLYLEVGGFEIRIGKWNAASSMLETCYICPSVVASSSHPEILDDIVQSGPGDFSEKLLKIYHKERILVGTDAFHCAYNHPNLRLRSALDVSYPLQDILHAPRSHVIQLLRNALDSVSEILGVDSMSDVQLVMNRKPTVGSEEMRIVLEAIFGQQACDHVALVNEAALAAQSLGLRSALVVDIGSASAYAVAVYDQNTIDSTLVSTGLGGEHVTEFLCTLLELQSFEHMSNFKTQPPRSRLQVARQLKEDYGFVTKDFESYSGLYHNKSLEYARRLLCRKRSVLEDERYRRSLEEDDLLRQDEFQLPDGSQVSVSLDLERFYSTELLFSPSALESCHSAANIEQIILDSVSAVDMRIRAEVCEVILLTGRSALLPGLSTRLEHDLLAPLRQLGVFSPRILVGEELEGSPSAAWKGFQSLLCNQNKIALNGPQKGWKGLEEAESVSRVKQMFLKKEEFQKKGVVLFTTMRE